MTLDRETNMHFDDAKRCVGQVRSKPIGVDESAFGHGRYTRSSFVATQGGLMHLVLAALLASQLDANATKDPLWAKALEIHPKAIVVDTHSDTTSPMTDEVLGIYFSAFPGPTWIWPG